jgi:CDP-diacylglycerol--serine O-phosphatidyltransferase|tara:strand:+ start:195 stop:971 length:777 start_codon:yes stop_codon:yes gene_type:complete
MSNKKIFSLVPNLLTTVALVFGLLSIFNIIKLFPLVDNEFLGIETFFLTEKSLWWSCIFLYIAAFIDFIDGKIARLLNKDSQFGAQYDSLSDLVCFGVAPSLLIYIVYLSQYNNLGIMCVIFYSVCVALRLSRFNSLPSDEKDRFFIGLPSPMAAGLLISVILIDYKFELFTADSVSNFFLVFIPVTGLLMVSNIPFAKKTFLNRMKKFNALIVLSIILISILTHIEIGSFVLFYSYLFFAIGKHVFIKYKAAQKVSL